MKLSLIRAPKIRYCLMLLFLLVFIVTNVNAQIEKGQTITFQAKDLPLTTVLSEITKQTNIKFLYSESAIIQNCTITLVVKNESLKNVLVELSKQTKLKFNRVDNTVSISVEKVVESPSATNQQWKLSGLVTDKEKVPVIGASVFIAGSKIGTVTDINGLFNLNVKEKSSLIVSYIGYDRKEVSVGTARSLEIVLSENAKQLNEVVVTAMGIERKSKTLTYATQTVGGQEFTRSKDANFINSLQGKSAGLQITPNSSGAGGGASKIILRGQSDMYGSNQPLIVLDGIPLSGGMGSQTGGNMVLGGARDGGDLMSMINPDDIASMTILKGPNAAALYGSKANNGVLIITTKKGREGKLRVDLSSNTDFETPVMFPQIQSTYGGEIQGYSMKLNGWGGKISNVSSTEMARLPYLTNQPVNNLSNFFSTGMNTNNSVSVNGGSENFQSYFSYGNTQAKGLIDNNKFSRHNFLFKQSFVLFNKHLVVDVSANYIRQEVQNQPVVGKALSPLLALYRSPRNVDMRYFATNYQHIATADDPLLAATETNNRKLVGHNIQSWPWYDQYLNNPYWLLNKTNVSDIKDRLLTTASIKGIVNENLFAQARVSIDQNNSRSSSYDYATLNIDSRLKGGRCYVGNNYSSDIYSDVLLSYNKRFADKIDVGATVGNSFTRKYNLGVSSVNYLDTAALPNVFLLDNNRLHDIQTSTSTSNRWGNNWDEAAFASVQVGLWDLVNLDVSYRMEWAQSFQQFAEEGKYKFFDFYSVGGNVLLKELFFKEQDAVNALKLRASYSVVGNAIPNNNYSAYSIDFHSGAVSRPPANFDFPRPNLTQSFEVGIDGAFLKNKLNFDLTFYNSVLKNQFRWITTSSGQSKPVNGGSVQNRGIEITSNYRIDFNSNTFWTPGITFAFNDNKVLTMYTDETGVVKPLSDGSKEFQYKQVLGNSYGDLYVNSFMRNTDGTLELDADGSPKAVAGKFDTYIGNATARFTFGFNNMFRYKGFSLYMLIDGKIGGKVLSITESDLDFYGLSQRSADARDASYAKTYTNSEGKQVTAMFFKLPNGQEVNTRRYFEVAGANPNELYAYDATNVRLREVSLGYTFTDLLGASKSLTVSVVGRNLGFLYKNSPVDPDISLSAGNGFSGIDVYSLPTTRHLGVNLKVTF